MHRFTPPISAGAHVVRWLTRATASATLALLPALTQAQATLPLPPQTSSFAPHARGFWFTAPVAFTITGLRVPTDASSAPQTVELVRLQAAPPRYPAATNGFTSLFRAVNDSGNGILPMSIPVARGDIIGVLGARDVISSEAPSPAHTTIAGHPVRLMRLGMQKHLLDTPAQYLWTEQSYGIGRVEIHYQPADAAR